MALVGERGGEWRGLAVLFVNASRAWEELVVSQNWSYMLVASGS